MGSVEAFFPWNCSIEVSKVVSPVPIFPLALEISAKDKIDVLILDLLL